MSLPSCVTEHPNRPKPGLTYAPPPAPVPLPPGPVAAPATQSTTTNTRVQVQVSLVGSVRYDGMTLPLVSPDGRRLAVQSGEPPSWQAVFAEKNVVPPLGTRLGAYQIEPGSTPKERWHTTPIEWPDPLPAGVMLGRAADDKGFLVEWARTDGSRWIGRVAWLTGKVEWLVQGPMVNAHAVLNTRGWLLYTRREVFGDTAVLVARSPQGQEATIGPEVGSFDYPLASADPEEVFVVGRTTGLTELLAFHIRAESGQPPKIAPPFARAALISADDGFSAFQAVASLQGPVLRPTPPATHDYEPLLIFHGGSGQMALFDAVSGAFTFLPPRTVAAVPWRSGTEDGYLCTSPEGLVFCPPPAVARPGETPPPLRTARLDTAPHVPRLTADPERPLVLFGPAKRDPGKLDVFLMRPVAETPPP